MFAAAPAIRKGVYGVPLASVDEPDLVGSAIAQALQLLEQGSVVLLEQLQSVIWSRRLLLVLDNFEHLRPQRFSSLSCWPSAR